jgi:hypothetical protein
MSERMINQEEQKIRNVIATSNMAGIQQARTESAIDTIDRLSGISKIEIPENISAEITALVAQLYGPGSETADADTIRDKFTRIGIDTRYIDVLPSDKRPSLQDIIYNFGQQYCEKIYNSEVNNEKK